MSVGNGKAQLTPKTDAPTSQSQETGDRLMSLYLNSIVENTRTTEWPVIRVITLSVVILIILVGVLIKTTWMR